MAPRLRQVKPPADAAPANSDVSACPFCRFDGLLGDLATHLEDCSGRRAYLLDSEASPSVPKATSRLEEITVLEQRTVGAGTGTLGEVSSRKDRLGLLHVALKELADEIDDTADRYETTGKGSLADMDSQVIRHAANIVHRLLQWELFPLVSPESYFKAGA